MAEKICLIKQPAGLGDIFFTQKIAHKYYQEGYKIIYPVIPQFTWLKNYIPFFNFPDINDSFLYKYLFNNKDEYFAEDLIFLPLQDADKKFANKRIMESKYIMSQLCYTDWAAYFIFNRNFEKEQMLFNSLNLSENDEYCLVSKNYGSPPAYLKYNINPQTSLKIIELDFKDEYTLFDWCKVIENASEIHMIDSAINFIIEKLKLKTDKLFLYSRRGNNFSEIDYLFKVPYHYQWM